MNALFIAAGEGSRMEKLTENTPKPLIKINGKSILERQIEMLKKNDIDEIIIITGPFVDKYKFQNVSYINDQKFKEHDQLGSLATAMDHIHDDILIIFADILFEESILEQISNNKSDIAIAIDMDWEKYEDRNENPISDADKVSIVDQNIKRIFKRKNDEDEKFPIGEFIGLMKLNQKGAKVFRDVFSKLEKTHSGRFHDAESFRHAKLIDFLQEMLEQKIEIRPEIINGKWCEIDTTQDLEIAEKMFRD